MGDMIDSDALDQIARAGHIDIDVIHETTARMHAHRIDAARRAEEFVPEDPEWLSVAEHDPLAWIDRLQVRMAWVVILCGVFGGAVFLGRLLMAWWLA